ncbi:unnamed protein product [Didymodactylos carnosus]|uniref:Uncharacterized protein n=1 Tax=Didymodactylos carnosus TaxID=1234261 RepID=A0A815HS52_9BILA|nr:unnamed protein product [Didymodactylos carnosus]CAF4230213.1 unnamed protein product [Didymodactylos carnosus]
MLERKHHHATIPPSPSHYDTIESEALANIKYHITQVIHVKGRHNCLPDDLSRNPIDVTDELMEIEYGLEVPEPHRHDGDRVSYGSKLADVVGVTTSSADNKEQAQATADQSETETDDTDDSKPQELEPTTYSVLPHHLDITHLIEEQRQDPEIRKKLVEIQTNPTKHPYLFEDSVLYKLQLRDGGKTVSKLRQITNDNLAVSHEERQISNVYSGTQANSSNFSKIFLKNAATQTRFRPCSWVSSTGLWYKTW